MPANFAQLQASIDALVTQVTATEGVEASAVALINGFAVAITQAVTDALTADNNADDTSIAAASAAIESTRARFAASGDALGVAVTSGNPPPPPPPVEPPVNPVEPPPEGFGRRR